MSVFEKLVDERFLSHRLRSSSTAGLAGGALAIVLFAWRYYVDHRWSWDLFAVGVAIVGVKVVLMGWHLIRD